MLTIDSHLGESLSSLLKEVKGKSVVTIREVWQERETGHNEQSSSGRIHATVPTRFDGN